MIWRGSPLLALLLLGCGTGVERTEPAARPSGRGGGAVGELTVLSYNVAGVPFGLSRSDPGRNVPLISPLLNRFDLVLIQESFGYTRQLMSAATHPFRYGPPAGIFNDGLALLSRAPTGAVARQRWRLCHGLLGAGSDCLASKGFSVTSLELARGAEVHVYNLHMDSGRDRLDHLARAAQAVQLLDELATRSAGAAVIVGGDTNLALAQDRAVERLLERGGLTDVCQALGCGEPRIDRIFYRGSSELELRALSWKIDPSFVDSQGQPLSDHEAIAVRIRWAVRAGGSGRAMGQRTPRRRRFCRPASDRGARPPFDVLMLRSEARAASVKA